MPGLPGTQTGRGLNAAGIVGIYNLLDEGGYGDNNHDDAAALTALFNAAPAGGITVILPTATYNFGSAPSVPNNCTLIITAGVTINNNQPTAAAGGAIVDLRNGLTVTGSVGASSIVSTSATALSVARAGTNYGLQVDESTVNAATGLKVTPAAAAAGLALAVISSGINENLTLDAKGSGTVTINGTATGGITLSRATTVSNDLTARRLKATGTALVNGDFAFAGWGAGAVGPTAGANSTDARGSVSATAGTGAAANSSTITLTFKDLTWTTAPIVLASITAPTGVILSVVTTVTATTCVFTVLGTVVNASAYTISWIAVG